jgi:hypothetical protein
MLHNPITLQRRKISPFTLEGKVLNGKFTVTAENSTVGSDANGGKL